MLLLVEMEGSWEWKKEVGSWEERQWKEERVEEQEVGKRIRRGERGGGSDGDDGGVVK